MVTTLQAKKGTGEVSPSSDLNSYVNITLVNILNLILSSLIGIHMPVESKTQVSPFKDYPVFW